MRSVLALLVGITPISALGQSTTPNTAAPCSTFQSLLLPNVDASKFEKAVKQFANKPERRTLDNFQATPDALGCAVNVDERFHLFLSDTLEPATFVFPALKATYGQIKDKDPSFGQGSKGFALRYTASLADSVNSKFFKLFFYPTLVREDPWYHRMNGRSLRVRLVHSLTHVVLTDTNDGSRRINLSEWLGASSSVAVSNLYHPDNKRGFAPGAQATATAVGTDIFSDFVAEFWPDIRPRICSGLHLPCK